MLVLVKKQQAIEARLKALGVTHVQWVEFQFGPPLLEALGASAMDLGFVADTFQALGIIPKKVNVRGIVWRAPAAQ